MATKTEECTTEHKWLEGLTKKQLVELRDEQQLPWQAVAAALGMTSATTARHAYRHLVRPPTESKLTATQKMWAFEAVALVGATKAALVKAIQGKRIEVQPIKDGGKVRTFTVDKVTAYAKGADEVEFVDANGKAHTVRTELISGTAAL